MTHLGRTLLFTLTLAPLGCDQKPTLPVNLPPVAGVIPPQTVFVGDTAHLVLPDYFTDPDGDNLAFTAMSSDPGLLSASVKTDTLHLVAVRQTDVTVTVTATDPGGLSASQSFLVEVPNREPGVELVLPPPDLFAGGSQIVPLDGYFSDPDGDPLVYEAESSSPDTLEVFVTSDTLVFAAVRQGTATVTVTVTDPGGLSASQSLQVAVTANPDRAPLEALYNANEEGWCEYMQNWMTDAPLEDWYGVDVNEGGRVSCLGWCDGGVEGGSIEKLRNLGGTIPPELGDLEALEVLSIQNWGSGTCGRGLGRLTGRIPPELGQLANLRELHLSENSLTGHIPSELGQLANLRGLGLRNNHLTGHIPPEMGDLAKLEGLLLNDNHLSGPVPLELAELPAMAAVRLDGNPDACTNSSVQAWLEEMWPDWSWVGEMPPGGGVRLCDEISVGAYLMQAVQSPDARVPLVAGRSALLRVLSLSPPIHAHFFVEGSKVYDMELPRVYLYTDSAPPTEPAKVPSFVVRPGLEMVIEGQQGRIPPQGRIAVGVEEVPTFNLTLVPIVGEQGWEGSVAIADSMVADPLDHWRLRYADLLPVGALQVTAHPPVEIDVPGSYPVLEAVRIVRMLEGGAGYWMGLVQRFSPGMAYTPGWVSYTNAAPGVIAHELGHNMSLRHAPCGTSDYVDRMYPHAGGRIGAWGYASRSIPPYWVRPERRDTGWWPQRLIAPEGAADFMSYCQPAWISDYHFTKALDYRLYNEAESGARIVRSTPVRSLLVSGGVDSSGTPFLEPAFVVNAPLSPPTGLGTWMLEGRNENDSVLFSHRFAMSPVADAGEVARGFMFTLPASSGWEALATVTLSGHGRSAVLDTTTNRPMSIWLDSNGQVRAILRRSATLPRHMDASRFDILLSRGIPPMEAWR